MVRNDQYDIILMFYNNKSNCEEEDKENISLEPNPRFLMAPVASNHEIFCFV